MYNYQEEKHKIFTEEGQRNFLKVRDHIDECLDIAGAVSMIKAIDIVSGNVWEQMAYVDRLVELGEIREITGEEVVGQDRIFVRAFA